MSYLLSELDKELAIPFVMASAAESGWGGRVARFRPGRPERFRLLALLLARGLALS